MADLGVRPTKLKLMPRVLRPFSTKLPSQLFPQGNDTYSLRQAKLSLPISSLRPRAIRPAIQH